MIALPLARINNARMGTHRLLPLWVATLALAGTAAVFVWLELRHELAILLGIQSRYERDTAVGHPVLEAIPAPGGGPSPAWLAVGAVSLVVLIVLHWSTLSRTSPIAALGFFLCGPVVAAIATVWFAFQAALAADRGMEPPPALATFDPYAFGAKLLCGALFGAAFFAIVAAIDKRDEWFNEF